MSTNTNCAAHTTCTCYGGASPWARLCRAADQAIPSLRAERRVKAERALHALLLSAATFPDEGAFYTPTPGPGEVRVYERAPHMHALINARVAGHLLPAVADGPAYDECCHA